MNPHLNLLFLVIILICIFPFIQSICPSSRCSISGPIVRFPFRLHKPNYTSPAGYINLSCCPQEADITILTLPNSDDFYVREIDYHHQQVILYDPQDCTANRLMNLNQLNSPFDIDYYYRKYTFLNCSKDSVQCSGVCSRQFVFINNPKKFIFRFRNLIFIDFLRRGPFHYYIPPCSVIHTPDVSHHSSFQKGIVAFI